MDSKHHSIIIHLWQRRTPAPGGPRPRPPPRPEDRRSSPVFAGSGCRSLRLDLRHSHRPRRLAALEAHARHGRLEQPAQPREPIRWHRPADGRHAQPHKRLQIAERRQVPRRVPAEVQPPQRPQVRQRLQLRDVVVGQPEVGEPPEVRQRTRVDYPITIEQQHFEGRQPGQRPQVVDPVPRQVQPP